MLYKTVGPMAHFAPISKEVREHAGLKTSPFALLSPLSHISTDHLPPCRKHLSVGEQDSRDDSTDQLTSWMFPKGTTEQDDLGTVGCGRGGGTDSGSGPGARQLRRELGGDDITRSVRTQQLSCRASQTQVPPLRMILGPLLSLFPTPSHDTQHPFAKDHFH